MDSPIPAKHTHTHHENERGVCIWQVTQGREKGVWGDGGCDQDILYMCMKLSKHKIKIF